MKTNSRDAQNLCVDSTWWVLSKNIKIFNFLLTKIFVTASWKSHFDFPKYLKISPNKSTGDVNQSCRAWIGLSSAFYRFEIRGGPQISFAKINRNEKSSFDVDISAILYKSEALLGKTWYSPKIIFLEMGPNNVIEGGESENRGPGARARVVYVVANVVLENSKIVKSI